MPQDMRVTDGRRARLLFTPFQHLQKFTIIFCNGYKSNLKADNPVFPSLAGHFTMTLLFLVKDLMDRGNRLSLSVSHANIRRFQDSHLGVSMTGMLIANSGPSRF